MNIGRISRFLTITIFSFLLVLPLITVHRTGGEHSKVENRILASKPILFNKNGSLNPQAGKQIKQWLEDHIGFRDQFVKLSSSIKFHIFKLSSSKMVHIGKDGWYYYTGDNNLQIATGEYPLTQETLDQILVTHIAIRDKLKAQGIEYVVVFPTSKVSIYPENMRYGNGKVRQTPVDIVADYLEKNSDLHCIRLKERLLNEKKNQQVFFKTDTHWTQAGSYVAYKEIIKKLKAWNLCDTDPVEVSFEQSTFSGEFNSMLGVKLPVDQIYNSIIRNPKAIMNPKTDKHKRFSDLVEREGITNPCWSFENNSLLKKRIVMTTGDSMFGGWNVTQLLAENFSEFYYIWEGANIRQSFLEEIKPDIVIAERTERYLNSYPIILAHFIRTPLNNVNSKIINYTWKDKELVVKVKNTGDQPWKYTDQVKLGLFIEGHDTGIRGLIPAKQSVEPGDIAIFRVSLVSYPYLLSKKFEVGMLQEGLKYFPERIIVEKFNGW